MMLPTDNDSISKCQGKKLLQKITPQCKMIKKKNELKEDVSYSTVIQELYFWL